jgi:signal transduction histidine kinase
MISSMNSTEALRFSRSENDRWLFGVAGGLSARLGVDVIFIRLAFILLTINYGFGLVLYFVAHALSVPSTQPTARRSVNERQNLGFCLLLLSLLFFLRSFHVWIGDGIMWPATLVAIGSTIIVLRSDTDAQRWETNRLASIFGSAPSRVRLAAGTIAVALGVGAFFAAHHSTGNTRTALAVLGTVAGMLLVFGPWLLRLGRQLIDERRRGIRTQERAEMGAHLHDSVLQTLAMIQRADSSERMASLARQQERDLRAWLHGRTTDEEASVKTALEALASRIDADHQVAVNVIVVGDQAITEELRPLLAATQESVTNAARHSGATTVHVYVEISNDKATALVRDEGRGFDINAIDEDRQGVRESIQGRMRRHGGEATIHSSSDTGTEVHLSLPLSRKDW